MPKVNYFEIQILSQKEDPVIRKTEELIVQDQGNSFAILANHAPLISYLPPAVKIIMKNPEQAEEWRLPQGGILQVQNNRVLIFDSANK